MKLIEKVARAICETAGGDPDRIIGLDQEQWTAFEKEAKAAIAAIKKHNSECQMKLIEKVARMNEQ